MLFCQLLDLLCFLYTNILPKKEDNNPFIICKYQLYSCKQALQQKQAYFLSFIVSKCPM